MENKLTELVEKLTSKHLTISTMESCTGGGLANAITNIPGASLVLKYSAVTYANEFKIKMGVSKELIDKYSVYSKEVSRSMAKAIKEFTGSDIGVGITGKLKKKDPYNDMGDDSKVFISIYYNDYFDITLNVSFDTRKENKNEIILKVTEELLKIL